MSQRSRIDSNPTTRDSIHLLQDCLTFSATRAASAELALAQEKYRQDWLTQRCLVSNLYCESSLKFPFNSRYAVLSMRDTLLTTYFHVLPFQESTRTSMRFILTLIYSYAALDSRALLYLSIVAG
ncbi:hypothetical protein B0H16DRAFT_1895084 [Mycena metata]|uniref:Uncharacterized protein n=1 Tax=Mycena metata TaxID=1033252 RepID=A0AAD7HQE2_9AGAR|nr:hypothetical protein B0H16DRAFT_1895084 [Mycena metata]